MDADHDGCLSALGMQIALRASAGIDLLSEDCKHSVDSGNANGVRTLDFNEFCESMGDLTHRQEGIQSQLSREQRKCDKC